MQHTSAIFQDVHQAAAAVDDLRAAGIPEDAIHYFGHDPEVLGKETVSSEGDIMRNDAALEATGDTATSMLAGAGIGVILGVAALAVPILGPAVAAGAVTTAAIPGAMATGGILGAAVGGIKEGLEKYYDADDAEYYSEQIGEGGVLIAVDSERDDVELTQVRDILVQNGGMRRMVA